MREKNVTWQTCLSEEKSKSTVVKEIKELLTHSPCPWKVRQEVQELTGYLLIAALGSVGPLWIMVGCCGTERMEMQCLHLLILSRASAHGYVFVCFIWSTHKSAFPFFSVEVTCGRWSFSTVLRQKWLAWSRQNCIPFHNLLAIAYIQIAREIWP